ncbi:up-regulator of cell proliferation-like isoform X2 [Rhinoderma darwinii]|uniref:up-regulator of cell proliferation-like isoform X2 n=1 Tax=Rhinoderma darwinii TaxID=43563 RepID=UPI003F67D163
MRGAQANLMDCLLSKLQLEEYQDSKLSLEHVMCIGKENENEYSAETSLPWNFLRKLIALDETARNTMKDDHEEANISGFSTEDDLFGTVKMSSRISLNSLHPLDVLCALLHCSDNFLQQVIFSKMSMCQFAVPLLLPADETKPCTFLLWPMRNIIKNWRPTSLLSSKGFRENNLVNISMPIFSFVRLGNCSLSKSKILNSVLSPSYTHHDFFVHQGIECGYHPRTISEGLLELFWYFPGGSQSSNIFHEPITVMNLRGELESNKEQFRLLTKVSSAVFIFSEGLQEKHWRLLESSASDNPNYYFIICLPEDKHCKEETKNSLLKLMTSLNLNSKHIVVKDSKMNEAEIVKEIQSLIRSLTKASPKFMTLEEVGDMANELGFFVDENVEECQRAKEQAKRITSQIMDVSQYKKQTLTLQGDLWKKITKNEKELCRMRKQGDVSGETYKSELKGHNGELRRQQSQQELQEDMKRFLLALIDLTHAEKLYFLKWMKIFLDDIARSNLKELQTEYLKNSTSMLALKQIDQKMSDSSLGLEHFLRELGQMHEAQFFKLNHKDLGQKLSDLPGLVADLLLYGFPLELMDGDASNIPLQWITDVLTSLDKKTGGQCRMRVITVLGVQSTGKSTLLNTMFGLQFPVASGRCTRGAFMTLIKVKENFKEELGCEFILVIDTEGLKAPELASLVDSYEHDNELATLVVGLSDITIINISMENSSEMKDILQIVVHAFLRMTKIGKKPNCHFVHQNVSDVSAHTMGIRDRKKLLEHLNEMTKCVAKMEKLEGITTFNDIMDYNINEHTWYISGLWYGIPPMAPINTGYSEGILSLKKYLIEFLKRKLQKPQTIPDFLEWLKSLWNAVKHEKFIFSFRNSLIADAYDQLSVKYSQLEWSFRKEMYNWMTEALISIKNERMENLTTETLTDFIQSTSEILSKEEKKMRNLLDTFFDSELENAHLIEKYREDFLKSIKNLRKGLNEEIINKCKEAIHIQKTKRKIEGLKDGYISKIEEKVTSLLSSCKDRTLKLDIEELEVEFHAMWDDTMRGLQVKSITKQDIDQIMLQQLRVEMSHKSGAINEKLLNIKTLFEFSDATYEVRDEHIDLKWYKKCQDKIWYKVAGLKDFYKQDYIFKSKQLAESLAEKGLSYVDQHVKMNENYHEMFCLELLEMVNERLQQKDVKNLHTTDHFELNLKLLLLGKAAPKFQKLHDNFVKLNDPHICLETLKSEYLSVFKAVFQEKDECKTRAKLFCELCLRPAIVQYVNHRLGQEIVNDILNSEDNMKYMSRTFFQLRVLCKLLEDHSFDQYVKYINNYERFVKDCILEFLKEKYEDPKDLRSLRSNIILPILQKLREIFQKSQIQVSTDVSEFLRKVCKMLHKDLVISQEDLKVVIFQNSVPVTQFAADVEFFLSELGEDIMLEMRLSTIESVLAIVILKPEEELFKKVIGCGKQCPFCKVPCEAGCAEHTEHFATVHRPQGLGRYRYVDTNVLCSSLCSTDVVTETSFRNSDTDWKFHPYKYYREFYPDWMIQPDPSITASDYWKFIFKEFNGHFAKEYNAKPASLPKDWYGITKGQALESLKESFRVK